MKSKQQYKDILGNCKRKQSAPSPLKKLNKNKNFHCKRQIAHDNECVIPSLSIFGLLWETELLAMCVPMLIEECAWGSGSREGFTILSGGW